MNNTPRIYVACLAAYNNGYLHGEWIDCDQDAEDIYAEIKEILKTSPISNAEEWAIHNYENWHKIEIAEHENIETVAELGQAIIEHGAAIAVYYSYWQKLEDFEDYYEGQHENKEDFIEDKLEQDGTFQAIENLGLNARYIDLKAIACDWFCGSYVSLQEDEGKTYIFTNH